VARIEWTDRPRLNIGLVFRKGEAIVRVRESGIVVGEHQVEEALAQQVFDEAPTGWIGIHMPLAEHGFELVGLETIEDLAADFLADACSQAAMGAALIEANRRQMKESVAAEVAAHTRQAIILSAVSAEAYINEFIYRGVRHRQDAIDRLSPPVRLSLAIELLTDQMLESEPVFGELKGLFSQRNDLVHFHPTIATRWIEDEWRTESKGIALQVHKERNPLRFPLIVIDFLIAVSRLTGFKVVYELEDVVRDAIEGTGAPTDKVNRLLCRAAKFDELQHDVE
jgi:hypothetical protein